MWKMLTGISLALSMSMSIFAMPDEDPPNPSVAVECCGRLRHGIVAIGGETTGTTITFNHVVCELQLHDDAAREFAREHHKEPVAATGTLRKIAGTEARVRWIIDVRKLAELDATKDEEGSRLTIQGMLRATDPRDGDYKGMTIEADGQFWQIDLSSDDKLRTQTVSLVGQPVVFTGSLERVTDEEACTPVVLRGKTLKRSDNLPGPSQRD